MYKLGEGVDMSSNGKVTITAEGDAGSVLQIFLGEGQYYPSNSTYNVNGAGGSVWVEHTFTGSGEESFTLDFSTSANSTADAWSDWTAKNNVQLIGYRPGTADAIFTIKEVWLASGGGSSNQDPVISDVSISPSNVTVGDVVSISVTADDADGSIVSTTIQVDGQTFNGTSTTWSPSFGGSYDVIVTVTDSDGAVVTRTETIVVTGGNQKPVISDISVSPSPVNINSSATITVTASDSDGSIASTTIQVDGQTTNASSASWTPTSVGSYDVIVTVTDNEGAVTTKTESVFVNDPSADYVTVVSPTNGGVIDNPGIITVDLEVNNPSVSEVWVKVTEPGSSFPVLTRVYGPDYDYKIFPDVNTGIGNYSIEVIARDNNRNQLESQTINFSTTGEVDYSEQPVNGVDATQSFTSTSIYPVPASDYVNVEVGARTNGEGSIEVFDVNGRVVYSQAYAAAGNNTYATRLSLENVDAGMYFVKMTINGESITEKLIVE
jgi:hypothetical protein